MAGSSSEVIKSLIVNVVIASSKGVGAAITDSGAMLAETLHSFADCGNQLLLLLWIQQSRKPADAKHPLGYGRNMYFYSFVVALLLFSGGGVFSIYEGIHKMQHPEAVGDITIAIVILALSIGLEGWATLGNIKLMNQRRGTTPFFKYLRDTKDSDLIVVFGENSAAVLGLLVALGAVLVSWQTGDGRWDALDPEIARQPLHVRAARVLGDLRIAIARHHLQPLSRPVPPPSSTLPVRLAASASSILQPTQASRARSHNRSSVSTSNRRCQTSS